MRAVLFLLLLVVLRSSEVFPQDDYTTRTRQLLEKYNELGLLNGTVLVAENGKILVSDAYGFSEYDARQPMVPSSVFVLASISKTITSTGILRLAGQGALSPDDEIIKFFPDLLYKGVTLKHLMSNTSGIPEYRPLFAGKWDPSQVAGNADVIKKLSEAKPPLNFEPGTRFQYSNTGFVLLASVIEKVSGKKFDQFMKDEIFAPAGMTNSVVFTRDIQYDIPDFAFPYLRVSLLNPVLIRPDEVQSLNWMRYLDGVKGDVSTACSAQDLFNFDMALLNGTLMDNKLLQEAFTPFIKEKSGEQSAEGYGYGWFIKNNKKGEKIVLHEGGMPGTSTYNYINIDRNRVIIVLSNTNYTRSPQIAEKIAAIFEGEEVELPKPPFSAELASYIRDKGHSGAADYARSISGSGNYEITEAEINVAGYEFLQEGNTDAAIEIFKVNVELFPGSWNVYDSLAEAFMIKGDKNGAIKNYKKSIELNPENDNGKKFLMELEQNK